jgi:hypothetical protein
MVLGTSLPHIQLGTNGFFPGDKAASVCEANHSPPSSTKINNECSYSSTSPYAYSAFIWPVSPLSAKEEPSCKEEKKNQ